MRDEAVLWARWKVRFIYLGDDVAIWGLVNEKVQLCEGWGSAVMPGRQWVKWQCRAVMPRGQWGIISWGMRQYCEIKWIVRSKDYKCGHKLASKIKDKGFEADLYKKHWVLQGPGKFLGLIFHGLTLSDQHVSKLTSYFADF